MLYKLLLIVFILEYMRPGSYIPIINAFKINTLLPLILFSVSFFHYDQLKPYNSQIFKRRETRWLLFFLALIWISIFTADITFNAFTIFKKVLGYIFLFWIIAREVNTLNRLKGLMALLIFMHIALVLINPEFIKDPTIRHYIKGVTFLGDGNDFALSILITLPFGLFLFHESKSKLFQSIYGFALLGLLISVIATQSRGATLSFFCILFYYWWRSKSKALFLFFIGLILVTLLAFYAPTQYVERMESISNYQADGSAQGRIEAWKTAVRMAAAHPLTGVGAGHFAVKFGTDFKPPELSGQPTPWLTAHSIYFLSLGELGIPGLIFSFFVIFGTLLITDKEIKKLASVSNESATKIRRLLLSLNSGLIGYGSAGAFLSALYYPHLFVIMGLYLSAHHVIHREYNDIYLILNEKGLGAGQYSVTH